MITTDEIRSALHNAHLLRLRYGVEDAVARAEDFDLITFDNWKECDLDDVTDEESARSTFIDYVIDYIVISEDLFDRAPDSYTDASFNAYVLDCADDLNMRKE